MAKKKKKKVWQSKQCDIDTKAGTEIEEAESRNKPMNMQSVSI